MSYYCYYAYFSIKNWIKSCLFHSTKIVKYQKVNYCELFSKLWLGPKNQKVQVVGWAAVRYEVFSIGLVLFINYLLKFEWLKGFLGQLFLQPAV